ncbi:hypothetical protein [Erythrobacter rubeus]|uniref:Uncharacterized protein n=1 Tax=Erythrobacter rubeus TaxID=2760803 RepID=A0ABR8KQ32_9SPHN|nr:hypothetical protein [Erythrobacter rubeus]MBD2841605.1 hypothetical protein [Erythrobacter rubeus]
MTRRTDNRTTRLPVKRGELPDFTPVPIKHRSDGWTAERQHDFIEALADTGSVEAACKHVNMSTVGAYRIRRLPEGESFAKAWEAALDLGVRRLEDIAMERALNGVEEPFYAYGNLVGTRKRYNDRLLMFMLRNRAPERFGNSVTKGGGDLKGLNAIGKMEKRRLKKKWRKEWEAERSTVSPEKVRARIDAKIEGLRVEIELRQQREWECLSEETRAAWDRFVELRDRDLDQAQADEEARMLVAEGPRDTINAVPQKRKKPEPKSRKTVHKLTDDGWD